MRTQPIVFHDLNLITSLNLKGHSYTLKHDPEAGLVGGVFTRSPRLEADISAYHAGSFDKLMLETRTRIYHETRAEKGVRR